MVSAARLGSKPGHGNPRIKAGKNGLVTRKNVAGANLGAKLKARLTEGTLNKTGKGKFVLAKSFGQKAKVLIRTGQANNVVKKTARPNNQQKFQNGSFPNRVQQQQQNRFVQQNQRPNLNRPQLFKAKVNQQANQRANQPQQFRAKVNQQQQFNPRANQQQQFNPRGNQQQQFNPRGNQQQQFNTRGNQQQQFIPRGNQQQQFNPRGNQLQQFNPRANQPQQFRPKPNQLQQFRPKPNQPQQFRQNASQNNETKLALDIINILLEDKKNKKNVDDVYDSPPRQQRTQRRPMNMNRKMKTVYVQQPAPQPVYIQAPAPAPKTVYVDENGYNVAAPVVVRRRAATQNPVQIIRPAGARMIQRPGMQRRLY